MAKGLGKKPLVGRSFALTILLGVFIAIMSVILVNLIVSYIYEAPNIEDFCKGSFGRAASYPGEIKGTNCIFNKTLQEQAQACISGGNGPVYDYDDNGCIISLKDCNDCQKRFDKVMEVYNRNVFFIFAIVGFIMIVAGLFVSPLLVQIALLPAGAASVIEAAARNFDNKLYVIITFALLIIMAVYLALKKLR